MFTPPFTLLILKRSHRPATIRITVPLFILVLTVIPLLCGAAGYELFKIMHSEPAERSPSASVTPLAIPDPASVGTVSGPPVSAVQKPDIRGIFISSARGPGTEVSFSLTNTIPDKEYYIWIVGNPDATTAGEMFIHPRGPVFRGLPVDYRNGILFDRSRGGDITVNLADEQAGIAVGSLRILVYSAEGDLLTDTHFTVGQDTGSSSQ